MNIVTAVLLLGVLGPIKPLDSYIMASHSIVMETLGEPKDIQSKDGVVTWDIGTTAVSFNKDGRVVSITTTSPQLKTSAGVKVGDSIGAVYKTYGWPAETITNHEVLKIGAPTTLKYQDRTIYLDTNLKIMGIEVHTKA